MLPPFIIDQIRKREEESRREEAMPRLELPLDYPMPPSSRPKVVDEDDSYRGVIVLDLGLPSASLPALHSGGPAPLRLIFAGPLAPFASFSPACAC